MTMKKEGPVSLKALLGTEQIAKNSVSPDPAIKRSHYFQQPRNLSPHRKSPSPLKIASVHAYKADTPFSMSPRRVF